MTQRMFAGLFGIPIATLRHWERGNRRPTGTALVLLHVIAVNPLAVRNAVRNVRSAHPGSMPEWEPKLSDRAPRGLSTPMDVDF